MRSFCLILVSEVECVLKIVVERRRRSLGEDVGREGEEGLAGEEEEGEEEEGRNGIKCFRRR